jgi:ubiquinol-cytochrome c reductase iron-sulfur subunit
VTAAFLASALASIGLVAVYLAGGNAQAEGILLAIALGGIGVGIVVWAVRLISAPVETEEHHDYASPEAVLADVRTGLGAEEITRRTLLVRLGLAAGGALAAALAIPVLSLGPSPGRSLFQTPWRAGARIVGEDGMPVRSADLGLGSVRTVFPEGFVGNADAATLLIRVRPADLRLDGERSGWAPDGCIGYSKICTHAGCPVGLYRAEDHALLCPCHQSTFDVLRGAVPTFGPAARPLPQLPIAVGEDGYLVARGDFPEPVGPSFWNLTHDAGPALTDDGDPREADE